MKPDSRVLARRIDAMVAFQNGQQVQYRMRRTTGPWMNDKGSGLVFNWSRYDYRIRPVLIEGWVDPSYIHPHGGACKEECVHVRQTEDKA